MIAVDTSALLSAAFEEPEGDNVLSILESADAIVISATTLAETLVVARRRGRAPQIEQLLADLDAEIAPVTDDFARSVADAYDRWGKGVNPAGLNFADCFAYALAMERSCPLLFVGDDFAKTDVIPAAAGS